MKRFILLVSLVLCFSGLIAQKKILFDNTKSETAGNADWVIDNDQPIPSPAQSGITSSTLENYWLGGLSSWGVEMVKQGFYVETLPSSGRITYGDGTNSQDLSKYNIFVVCEPNNRFTDAEKTAILNFVSNGGGLFMVSDHAIADRDNDGWDALMVWNDFLTNNSVKNNPFGFTFDVGSNISAVPSNNVANRPTDPILHGLKGDVEGIEFHNGGTMTISTADNASVKAAVYNIGYSNTGTTGVMVAYATYGSGRVVAVGDSSVPEDVTPQSGTTYDGWNEANGDNGVLITNGTLWLAQTTVNPEPSNNVTGFSTTDITSKSIKLVWTDATAGNLPSGYLLKWSTSATITAPTDGVAVNNGAGVANVVQGVQTYTVTGLNPNTTYYFKIYPYSNSGSNINYLVSSTPFASAQTAEGAVVINSENFENCGAITWTPYDVAGDDFWTCGSGYEEMNGFGGTTDEDWLISPALNLNGYSSEVLSFTSATQYSGPALELVYSTNYDGTSNPTTQGTWNSLNFTLATTTDFAPSGNISLAGISGSSVYIAFKYKATGTTSGTAALWRVDDILIEGSNGTTTSPTVLSYSPANNSANVLPSDNLVLTFSESVKQGTAGSITIYNSNGTVFESIPYNDSRITISNSTITVNPSGSFVSSASYYVNIDGTVFQSLSNIAYGGISNNSTWKFSIKDMVAPTVLTYSPTDNATTVTITENLILTFSESVKRGTSGNISIYNFNSTVFELIPYSDSRLLFSDNVVTINPTNSFSGGADYYVTVDANAITDLSNNAFVGISSATAWNFKTQTTSSISELNSDELIVFPNPAKDKITVKLFKTSAFKSICIIDLNGKTLYKSSNVDENPIDVSNFPRGMYFVKLVADGKIYLKKLIIQ